MHIALLILAAAILTGCETGPQTIQSSAPTVTYRYQRGEADQVHQRAADYCAQYGRRAQVARTGTQGTDLVVQYECL